MFWPFAWILIPLAGILFGAFKEWLSFKEKQLQLGQSTTDLEKQVTDLTSRLKAAELSKKELLSRIQNLETIVTSQDWDTLHKGDELKESAQSVTSASPLLEIPVEEDETAEKAKALARRMRV